jgi:hypothetical protein
VFWIYVLGVGGGAIPRRTNNVCGQENEDVECEMYCWR